MQKPDGGDTKPITDIEIGPITVCQLVCGDFWLGGIRIPVCVPVNCYVEKK